MGTNSQLMMIRRNKNKSRLSKYPEVIYRSENCDTNYGNILIKKVAFSRVISMPVIRSHTVLIGLISLIIMIIIIVIIIIIIMMMMMTMMMIMMMVMMMMMMMMMTMMMMMMMMIKK